MYSGSIPTYMIKNIWQGEALPLLTSHISMHARCQALPLPSSTRPQPCHSPLSMQPKSWFPAQPEQRSGLMIDELDTWAAHGDIAPSSSHTHRVHT